LRWTDSWISFRSRISQKPLVMSFMETFLSTKLKIGCCSSRRLSSCDGFSLIVVHILLLSDCYSVSSQVVLQYDLLKIL
jgi:hypothetical protein